MAFSIPPQVYQVLYIFIAVVVCLVIIALIGGIAWLFMYNKQFSKTRVIVYKEYVDTNGNRVPIILDLKETGGIIKDRKLKKFVFHMRKRNIYMGESEHGQDGVNEATGQLNIPTIPLEGGKDVIFVQQVGMKKYAFGKPFLVDSSQLKIKVTDADMAESIRGYDMNAKAYSKKDNPLLMIGTVAICAVVIMIMIIFTLSKFDLIAQAASQFKEASIVCESTATFNWYLLLNPTVVGTALNFTQVTNSVVDVDAVSTNATTVTGGTTLATGTLKQTNEGSVIVDGDTDYLLGSTIAGVSDIVVLAVQRITGTTETFYGSINWREND